MSLDGKKITRESAWAEKIVFFPNSDAEAELLQKKLMKAGFRWIDGDESICELERCRKDGLFLKAGKMFLKGKEEVEHRDQYVACPIRQLDEDIGSASPDRIMDMFNALAAQLQRIETRLAAIEGEARPASLDKPKHLKSPGSDGP